MNDQLEQLKIQNLTLKERCEASLTEAGFVGAVIRTHYIWMVNDVIDYDKREIHTERDLSRLYKRVDQLVTVGETYKFPLPPFEPRFRNCFRILHRALAWIVDLQTVEDRTSEATQTKLAAGLKELLDELHAEQEKIINQLKGDNDAS